MTPIPSYHVKTHCPGAGRPTCLGASAEVARASAPRRPLDSNSTAGTRKRVSRRTRASHRPGCAPRTDQALAGKEDASPACGREIAIYRNTYTKRLKTLPGARGLFNSGFTTQHPTRDSIN